MHQFHHLHNKIRPFQIKKPESAPCFRGKQNRCANQGFRPGSSSSRLSHLQYVSELTFLRFVASLGKNRDSWKSNDSGSRLHSEVAKSEMWSLLVRDAFSYHCLHKNMCHFFSFLLYRSVSLSRSLECKNSLENYHQEMNMDVKEGRGNEEWEPRSSQVSVTITRGPHESFQASESLTCDSICLKMF